MSYKRFYIFDPTLVGFVGRSTDTKPTSTDVNIPFGSSYMETDTQFLYIYGSTGGWVQWRNFSTG